MSRPTRRGGRLLTLVGTVLIAVSSSTAAAATADPIACGAPATLPAPTPQGLKATAITQTGATLTWTAPPIAGCTTAPVAFKVVDQSSGATLGQVAAPATSLAVSGLTPNTIYNVVVQAITAAGTVASSTQIPFATASTTGSIINYGYSVAGTATLKTLVKGSMQLTGSIATTLNITYGTFTADLTIAPATAQMTAIGFLPVTATVNLVPTEKVTGTLTPKGALQATVQLRVELPSVKVFGLTIAGGSNCQTAQPSTLPLTATGFSPLNGGKLAGTFSIGPLTGCGWLNGLVSPLTSGTGNGFSVALGQL